MNPLLTIAVINYNQGIYFEDCFNAIRSQVFQDFELIIVDDKSTDNSVEIIANTLKGFDKYHHFVINETNKGICANLNIALNLARGKYFAFIASDDWMGPESYQIFIDSLQSMEESVGAVFGDCTLVDTSKKLLYPSFIYHFRKNVQFPPSGDIFGELLNNNFIPAMSAVIKTQCLKMIGGFDERLKLEDHDMWLRLAKDYQIRFVPGIEAYYRILPHSLIRTLGARKYEDSIEMYLKHADLPSFKELIRKKITHCCEQLYFSGSAKLDYYLDKCKPYIKWGPRIGVILFLYRFCSNGTKRPLLNISKFDERWRAIRNLNIKNVQQLDVITDNNHEKSLLKRLISFQNKVPPQILRIGIFSKALMASCYLINRDRFKKL